MDAGTKCKIHEVEVESLETIKRLGLPQRKIKNGQVRVSPSSQPTDIISHDDCVCFQYCKNHH